MSGIMLGYENEPERNPILIVNGSKPFNAEPPQTLLIEQRSTPNDLFFIRHHYPVPVLDENTFILELHGLGGVHLMNFSVHDIKTKFPKRNVEATIQCAGNRRKDLADFQLVRGLKWGVGGISNAVWTGASLKDVLKWGNWGPSENVNHIQFEGCDVDDRGQPYGASIPITVFNNSDAIIAYEMNGEPLSRDHGYPLRIVVPGVVGARHVKWVKKIILSEEESHSYWQQKYYKGLPPNINQENIEEYLKTAPAIQEMPITSAICFPPNDHKVETDTITIKGYAWSGGGRGIIRVDISLDGGAHWLNTELQTPDQPLIKRWAWTFWQATVPIPKDATCLNICSKAVDTSYNTQPDDISAVWNMRGVLNNTRHHVRVNVSRPQL